MSEKPDTVRIYEVRPGLKLHAGTGSITWRDGFPRIECEANIPERVYGLIESSLYDNLTEGQWSYEGIDWHWQAWKEHHPSGTKE